ncbi:hypothetical protein BN1002_03878 [Bacillus sp. B-jedd]|nr:hypothetical protein BN1002_03878 [Bacillus sp. B-jedd]
MEALFRSLLAKTAPNWIINVWNWIIDRPNWIINVEIRIINRGNSIINSVNWIIEHEIRIINKLISQKEPEPHSQVNEKQVKKAKTGCNSSLW